MIRHLIGSSIKSSALTIGFICILSSNLFANSVIASWGANVEPDLKGYKLYYGTTQGDYTECVDVGNVTKKEITDLTDGELYFFAVTAYDSSNNESPKSTEVSTLVGDNLVTPKPGTNSDSTGAKWKSVPGANGYKLLRSYNPYGDFAEHGTFGADKNSHQEKIDKKTAGTGLFYKVRATKNDTVLYEFQTTGHYFVALKHDLNLVSFPFVLGDSSLSTMLGTQFKGSNMKALSDRVHVYNHDTNQHETAWFFQDPNEADRLHNKWVNLSGSEESSIKISPNESFWIELNQSRTDTVFVFSGLVCADTARTIILKQGYNYIGNPFPVEVPLDSSGLADVLTGSELKSGADYLVEWKNNTFRSAWLYDKDGEAWDGKFMEESGAGPTDMSFRPGYGYVVWVKNPLLNNTWILPNPGAKYSN